MQSRTNLSLMEYLDAEDPGDQVIREDFQMDTGGDELSKDSDYRLLKRKRDLERKAARKAHDKWLDEQELPSYRTRG